MVRPTRSRPFSLLAACAVAWALLLSTPGAALADWQTSRGADIAASTLDLAIVRPLATAKVIVGAVFFVPAALFSAPMGREGYEGAYESLIQLTVSDGITPDRVADWMVAEDGESEYTIGLEGAKEVLAFHTVSDLLAALPAPSNPGAWDGQPVRIQRATALEGSDLDTKQDHLFGDWGDESEMYPQGNVSIPVFLDQARTAMNYLRDQTDHKNAMDDWIKEDGDPYLNPDFYRWSSPLWSFGRIAYAHVFALEGVVEVNAGAWRLRIRARTDPGIDRVVMIERWLTPGEWAELQTVWTYSYKSVVIDSTSGFSYSLPYRLALAHPARQYWYDTYGVWIDIPRCPRFGECHPMVDDWNLFNQALSEWTP